MVPRLLSSTIPPPVPAKTWLGVGLLELGLTPSLARVQVSNWANSNPSPNPRPALAPALLPTTVKKTSQKLSDATVCRRLLSVSDDPCACLGLGVGVGVGVGVRVGVGKG